MTKPTLVRMRVEDVGLVDWNPRIATEDEIAKLRKSFHTFGQIEPIVINKSTGSLLAGEQRVKSLLLEGVEEVDVFEITLEESKERAACIALNNHAGEYDIASLGTLLDKVEDSMLESTLLGDSILESYGKTLDAALEAVELPKERKKATKKPSHSLSRSLRFADAKQRARFQNILIALGDKYPEQETIGARIACMAGAIQKGGGSHG